VDGNFTPDKILFASMDGGAVGSIYFPAGRIRLIHPKGPEISTHGEIQRFTISNADYHAHWHGPPKLTVVTVQRLASCKPAVADQGERLVEFWPGGRHPSRGGPKAFNFTLTQKQ